MTKVIRYQFFASIYTALENLLPAFLVFRQPGAVRANLSMHKRGLTKAASGIANPHFDAGVFASFPASWQSIHRLSINALVPPLFCPHQTRFTSHGVSSFSTTAHRQPVEALCPEATGVGLAMGRRAQQQIGCRQTKNRLASGHLKYTTASGQSQRVFSQ